MDETFLGGRGTHTDGRGTDRHLIAIAAEIRGRAIGRIRMAPIEEASAASLVGFIEVAVERGAVIRTDGERGV